MCPDFSFINRPDLSMLRSWPKAGDGVQLPFNLHVQLFGAVWVVRPSNNSKGLAMKKIVLAIAAVASLAASAVVMPAPADARDGGAVAAGVLGGLAAGAIIGGAAASAPPAYYAPGPAYVAGPPCYWQRQRFWDGYGWRIRRVQVCN